LSSSFRIFSFNPLQKPDLSRCFLFFFHLLLSSMKLYFSSLYQFALQFIQYSALCFVIGLQYAIGLHPSLVQPLSAILITFKHPNFIQEHQIILFLIDERKIFSQSTILYHNCIEFLLSFPFFMI
jgi:hypothetical protein